MGSVAPAGAAFQGRERAASAATPRRDFVHGGIRSGTRPRPSRGASRVHPTGCRFRPLRQLVPASERARVSVAPCGGGR